MATTYTKHAPREAASKIVCEIATLVDAKEQEEEGIRKPRSFSKTRNSNMNLRS
jgi:hypothetical protein